MPILEAQGLVKYYGRRKVVDGVKFEVDVGEVVGLLGPNGAGKTTSFRMTTGQVTPNEGKVRFAGKDVTHLPMYLRARLGMGYLAQETSVFRKLTVEQNILAILEAIPFYRSLGRKLTKAERFKKTDEVLEKFGLSHLRKNNAARLSGGEKRRLEIARCLVCDPLLILLDEPFTGIDPQTIEDIQQIVRGLRDEGIGILVTDHRVREILTITDRSYLIKGGRVVTHGTPQEIVRDPIAISEYLGNSFTNDSLSRGAALPALAPPPQQQPAIQAIHEVVEQEKVHRLIERLQASDPAAVDELLQHGPDAVPALLEALERRDVELRQQALDILQRLLDEPADFDPYAPEAQRRQQIAHLRERTERKAG
ncbi:MAG TPA: LPS export ABC transporter ATP-binding protein [Gemmataceae bacterium]|nr:LPS export ABC transporter ATP-binding protein [Gemmataceae bacterium]